MRTMVRRRESELGWGRLLRGTAWTAVACYGATVLLIRDLEALAIGLGFLGGIGLLRFRKGRLGVVLLGVLFADAAAWMIPAAASNVRHGEGLFETLVPATIAAVSLVGLAGAVGRLAGRRWGRGERGPRTAAALGAAGLALTVAVSLLGVGTAQSSRPGDIVLTAERARFSETSLVAEAGGVTVHMDNRDLFWHTFTVPDLEVNLNVPVRGERRVTFEATAGTYEFICAVPGHVQAGMKGTLTVR